MLARGRCATHVRSAIFPTESDIRWCHARRARRCRRRIRRHEAARRRRTRRSLRRGQPLRRVLPVGGCVRRRRRRADVDRNALRGDNAHRCRRIRRYRDRVRRRPVGRQAHRPGAGRRGAEAPIAMPPDGVDLYGFVHSGACGSAGGPPGDYALASHPAVGAGVSGCDGRARRDIRSRRRRIHIGGCLGRHRPGAGPRRGRPRRRFGPRGRTVACGVPQAFRRPIAVLRAPSRRSHPSDRPSEPSPRPSQPNRPQITTSKPLPHRQV